MSWLERQTERVRTFRPEVVDGFIASIFLVVGVLSTYGQDIRDDRGLIEHGFRDPSAWLVLTSLMICAPIAVRRRWPLPALLVSSAGILIHILIGWPEGALPLAVLLLTYTVGAWCPPRQAVGGLVAICVTVIFLGFADAPGLDTVGVFGVMAQFAAGWAIGVAFRNRRAASDAKVREADERAESARQSAARVLAEERLRIAQELHDVVAHSMSVIAVQAGVGAHVIHDRPEQARAALDAISATSRATLTELRRLLGVLRDTDGARSPAPAPALGDLPHLVEDVRGAGVPVTLRVEGAADCIHPGVELSAYRIVQEALTNVIKHAGHPSRVDVHVEHRPGSLTIEVVDDGRGMSARPTSSAVDDGSGNEGSGHGLIGMRERVELWGGDLVVGPAAGGGYRVKALLPYGDSE